MISGDFELTIVHADTPTLLANRDVEDVQAQVQIYELLTRRLHAAGARSVAVTSIVTAEVSVAKR